VQGYAYFFQDQLVHRWRLQRSKVLQKLVYLIAITALKRDDGQRFCGTGSG
jgi:hypothetical protein